MNHLDLIAQIIGKLKEIGETKLAEEVSDAQSSASTGGELIVMVASKLLEIKEKYPKAYFPIEREVKDLIVFANSIGLYPIWRQ